MPYKIVMSDEAAASLDRLMKLTGRERRGEVMKDALTLFEDLVDRATRGERVFVGTDKPSAEYQYQPLMEAKKRAARG